MRRIVDEVSNQRPYDSLDKKEMEAYRKRVAEAASQDAKNELDLEMARLNAPNQTILKEKQRLQWLCSSLVIIVAIALSYWVFTWGDVEKYRLDHDYKVKQLEIGVKPQS